MRYGIWCAVSGGVSGHREAWLKQGNELLVFNDYESAKQSAKELQDAKRNHPSAVFAYVPRPI